MDEAGRAAQVRLAAQGDADALQRLIVCYHAPLRRVLDRQIDKRFRRHVDPDDVLQNAYIAAFNAVAACEFDSPGRFYKWLERVALNQLKDAQRNLQRKKRAVVRDRSAPPATGTSYPDLIARLSSPDSTPSRHVAKVEATAAVMSSLARLTDDQRRAIRMRFLEGRPVPEIASSLGKSEPAVHMLFHRGLKALRELMGSITHYLTDL